MESPIVKRAIDILLTAVVSTLIALAQAYLFSKTGHYTDQTVALMAGGIGGTIRTGYHIINS